MVATCIIVGALLPQGYSKGASQSCLAGRATVLRMRFGWRWLTPGVGWEVAEELVEAAQRLHRLTIVQVGLQLSRHSLSAYTSFSSTPCSKKMTAD